MMDNFHHRSSLLRQRNKAFKKGQRHASKRSLKDESKGRVESIPDTIKTNKRLSNKLERENKQKQLRKAKTMSLLEKRRKAALSDAPVIVLLVPFTASANAHELHQWILESPAVTSHRSLLQWNDYILLKGTSDEASTRWNLLSVDMEDLSRVVDLLKISDVVVPVFYADELAEDFTPASYCLEVLRTMGVSRLIPIAMFPEKRRDHEDLLKQHEMNAVRKHRAQFLVDQSVAEEVEQVRPIPLSHQGQIYQLIRGVATKTPRRPKWRESRSYVLGDSCQWVDKNVLQVVGYIRGRPWLCKQLLYLSGIGIFQPIKITTKKEPCPKKSIHKIMDWEDTEKVILETIPGDPSFDSTTSFYEEDITDKEPIEEHMDDDYSDSIENNEYLSFPEEEDNHFQEPTDAYETYIQSTTHDEPSSDNEMELVNHEDDTVIDKDELEKLRNEMKDELLFPDERDTPLDQPARERFRKYRGLDSLANSEWDAEQDLPPEYKRIFKFPNFNAFRKKQLALENKLLQHNHNGDIIESGMYVAFYLHVEESERDHVASLFEHLCGRSLIAVCLHRNEHRYSVIHFHIRRTLFDYHLQREEEDGTQTDNFELPTDKLPCSASSVVKSKDLLEIQCGFFKYLARPIFSVTVNHSQKLKYIKFLPNHQTIVASIYGPCVYPPAPVLVIKPSQDHLIARGSILSIDTDRIILKRIVLSGFPYRVFKSRAVVRYMFFNREDILWFQPYPLWTKRGRLGNIEEPIQFV
ncbi:Pre-rRNA-processing protein TSR1 [Galdieria sulphuraria]|nr:Pre-rRNA-processing protein TSR1 [Galdieria sulphuraria]